MICCDCESVRLLREGKRTEADPGNRSRSYASNIVQQVLMLDIKSSFFRTNRT